MGVLYADGDEAGEGLAEGEGALGVGVGAGRSGDDDTESGLAVVYGDGDAPCIAASGCQGSGLGGDPGGEVSRVSLGEVWTEPGAVGESQDMAVGLGEVQGNVVVPVAFDYLAAYFAGQVVHVGGEGEDDAGDLEQGSLFVHRSLSPRSPCVRVHAGISLACMSLVGGGNHPNPSPHPEGEGVLA